jgi:hypothetical protein
MFDAVPHRRLLAAVSLAFATVAALVVLGLPGAAHGAGPTCQTGAASFAFTGDQQCYVVPAGIRRLRVTAVGAKGGAASTGIAGKGAKVTADLPVTPGQTLFVLVGGDGSVQDGGFNGGGSGAGEGPASAGGGGASDVRTCATDAVTCADGSPDTLHSRLVVAGGGGGSGGDSSAHGSHGDTAGAGGDAGLTGHDGGSGSSNASNEPGMGGTATAGGTGGNSNGQAIISGQDGSLGSGGTGGTGFSHAGGGGGGGGLFGGGGAEGGFGPGDSAAMGSGGGGGSSLAPASPDIAVATTTDAAGVTIVPVELPIAITTPASGISTTGATLGGVVAPRNGVGATWHFELGPTTAYGQTIDGGTLSAGADGQEVAAELAGLSPGTYHCRVVATSVYGPTTGADESFTIPAPAPAGGGQTGGGPTLPPTGTPSDTTPPVIALVGVPKSIKLTTLEKKGLTFTESANESTAWANDLLGNAHSVALAKVPAFNITIAESVFKIGSGKHTVHLKPRRGSITKAKKVKLHVTVVATDAGGNRTTVTKTVKVR